MSGSGSNRATWLILARGRKVRHWRLRTVAGVCALALGSTALGGAVVGFGMAEPAVELLVADGSEIDDVIDVYEQRIGAMKRQIDTITNQQVNERRSMEAKIAELLERQRRLTERQGQLGTVIERAASVDPDVVPAPRSKPGEIDVTPPQTQASLAPSPRLTRDALAAFMPLSDRAPTPGEVFSSIDRSLETLDRTQRTSVTVLASEADRKAESILAELDRIGFGDAVATGGPFIAADLPFEQSITALDSALEKLAAAKRAAVKAPIGHPLKGQQMTSRFGPRRDPFNRRRAMHSGIDFRAGYGHPIRATGAGVVRRAGPNGGYGRFVEIDHGNGITTRYAHMTKILVRKGQRIETGAKIGTVGSTGRSTGPHLHYEIRRHGKAMNPLPFLQTGQSVARYL